MYPPSRTPLLLSLLLLVILSPLPAFAQSNIILGGTVFRESGRLEGEEQIVTQERDESFDFKNSSFLSTRIAFLRPFTDSIYIGGGLDFIGTYQANMLDEDGEADDPPDLYTFGPLLEPSVIAEFRIGLLKDYSLAIGLQAGIPVLFPRHDLAAEIRDLDDQNVRITQLPRFGLTAGPHAAFLWAFDERLALRADLAFQWQSLFIFNTTQEVDGSAYRKEWSTSTLRTRLGISLQISL